MSQAYRRRPPPRRPPPRRYPPPRRARSDEPHALARVFALFLAIVFVAGLVAALVLNVIEIQLTSPNAYKSAFRQADIYSRLPALVAAQIAPEVDADLSQSDWTLILEGLMPPGYFETQIENGIDGIFEGLYGSGGPVTISTREIKTKLAGEEGVNVVMDIIQTRPPCTAEQVARLFASETTGESIASLLTCSPPPELLDVLRPAVQGGLASLAAAIPDDVALLAIGMAGVAPTLRTTRLLLRMIILIPVIAGLLISMLVFRGMRSVANWWGIPLIIAGVISLAGALILLPLGDILIDTTIFQMRALGLSAEFASLVFDVGARIVGGIVVRIVIVAFALALLGAGLWFGAALLGGINLSPRPRRPTPRY